MAAPRKENIKENILSAARTLLDSKAIADISLKDIADAAGISKGTLYYHYKTKGEIFFDLIDRHLDKQWRDFVSWTENKEKDTSIQRLAKYVLERNIADAGLRIQLFSEAQTGDAEIRKRLIKRYAEFEALISQKIAERTSLPADYLTWLILLASDGIIVQKAIQNEDFDADAFIKQSAELLQEVNK